MSVVPKLNLNKHPKDCDNLSLVESSKCTVRYLFDRKNLHRF